MQELLHDTGKISFKIIGAIVEGGKTNHLPSAATAASKPSSSSPGISLFQLRLGGLDPVGETTRTGTEILISCTENKHCLDW